MKQIFIVTLALFLFSGCTPQPTLQPQQKCMSAQQLNLYGYDYLEKVAKLLREDKKNIESFEMFINVMKGTVDSYANMIRSSVYISNVVRFLPIPYAGEVSNTTKLISKTVLNLGGAASTLNRYKNTTNIFLADFDKIDKRNIKAVEIAKLALYADTKLLSDANNLEAALKEISASATMMAATTQSIADALDTTSGYMNQAKGFVGMGQPSSSDEKSKVVQNRNSINDRMIQLSQKIVLLEKSGEFHRFNIAKAHIYADLAVELEK